MWNTVLTAKEGNEEYFSYKTRASGVSCERSANILQNIALKCGLPSLFKGAQTLRRLTRLAMSLKLCVGLLTVSRADKPKASVGRANGDDGSGHCAGANECSLETGGLLSRLGYEQEKLVYDDTG